MGVEHPGAGGTALPSLLFPALPCTTYPNAVGSRPQANPTQPVASRTRLPLFKPQTSGNMGVEHPGAGGTALPSLLFSTLPYTTYPSAVGSRPRANQTQPVASRTCSPLFDPQTSGNMGVEHPGVGGTSLPVLLFPALPYTTYPNAVGS